jgi:serine/threonine protein kinase
MPLSAGVMLGPYEIQLPLGAGGMGEVYRARDIRLDRCVAIEILPAHLSSNPEAKPRFDREARAISSLNHTNICTLHDVGHQNGIDCLGWSIWTATPPALSRVASGGPEVIKPEIGNPCPFQSFSPSGPQRPQMSFLATYGRT